MKDLLVDSSVLIEYFKGNERAVKLLESFENADVVLHINDVVFSEVVYILLGHYLGRSPRAMKGNPEKLPPENEEVFKVLKAFGFIPVEQSTVFKAMTLIQKYAMLPNDALILATCVEHDFSLVTLDEDFKLPSEKEGVQTITR
ncbi:type II toxin-antitoxin system VapC family toxin [Thermococcus pacificus]|uniref:Nucleotide-binding protein n=1 Tax=Thermococcus pacificus TaxID=71998 RepID=A0A218P885_9EURY|nr:type II toxin-antitoxin system VapC family toxin [Thermococcus pacificus]ASJ06992.1 nucleotide-binding protein [Thermococcus pacificus]